jgi:hypothetical protein
LCRLASSEMNTKCQRVLHSPHLHR